MRDRSIAFGGICLILAFFLGDIGRFMTEQMPNVRPPTPADRAKQGRVAAAV